MKSEIEKLKEENKYLKQRLVQMSDVLRFCALPSVGTYYQQESARKMVQEGVKLVWDRHNEDGTTHESYKNWIRGCHDTPEKVEQAIKELEEREATLFSEEYYEWL